MPLAPTRLAVHWNENRFVLPLGAKSTTLQRGDTAPVLRANLYRPDGEPADLLGATVRFRMREARSREQLIDAPAVVEDAAAALVSYAWQAGDTDTPGSYEAWLVVTYPSGQVESFPNAGSHVVRVMP